MQFVKIVLILNLGIVFCAPNPPKVDVIETNEIPSVSIGAGGVSASWGGYSAKAGLGGNVGVGGGLYASADSPHGSAAAGLGGQVKSGDSTSGVLGASASSPYGGSASAGLGGNTGISGGLHASAGSPHGNAAAGLGGQVGGASSASVAHSGSASTSIGGSSAGSVASAGSFASSGASSGGGQTQVIYTNNHQGGLFDNIFNIPISVLQAVNGFLNQQGPVTKTVRVHGHRHGGPVIENRNSFAQSSSSASAQAGVNEQVASEHHIPVQASSGTVGSAGATVMVQKRPVNYDNIFNIPISALRAVNKLLNDGAAAITKNIRIQGSAQTSQGGAQTSYAPSSFTANVAATGQVQVGHEAQGNSNVDSYHSA